MGRNRLTPPVEKDTSTVPPEKPPSASGLESFKRERPFGAAEMTLILFILDLSASMAGDPIECLRKGFRLFLEAVAKHPRANKAVEVALISCVGNSRRFSRHFNRRPRWWNRNSRQAEVLH